MENGYDLEAEVTLWTFEKGGRKQGFPSAFNGPHIYLDNCEWLAQFTLRERERLEPGETARVFVTFFYQPHRLLGKLYPGREFLLHEGYHPIGEGKIIALLNFEKHAEEAKQQEIRDKDLRLRSEKKVVPLPWERPPRKQKKKKKSK